MENKKLIQICFVIFLIFISIAVLAQATAPFESLVQKDASGPQAPFANLAQSNTQENAAANGKVPFESLVQKDAKGPQVPFESLAQNNNRAENAAKESNVEEAAKNPSLSWLYVAFPIFIVAGMLTYIEVRRKNDHIKLMSQTKQYKTDSLRNYVMTNLKKGYGKEQIRDALVKNNYNNQEIQDAFRGIR